MNRALLRVSLCRSSRYEAARSFPSISGASISRHNLSSPLIYSHANGRPFSSVRRLRSDIPSVNSSGLHKSLPNEEDAQPETEPPAPTQNIPWYLQEEMPVTESQPLSSRDHLPELPENPPEILPALLEYTFKDLGLDELKLFDLRSLETPPALGANAIMIIGTARSVKHLNVAADRLCRWLRSNYKLSPYADGLLGRNELKIKLRRKARRARAASQSGAMMDEKDDGITTGWICVNAGVVEEAPAAEQEVADQVLEGFGNISAGTRVVVQMFTEEKRAEVDLDGLWQGNLDRAERKKQRDSEVIADIPPQEVRAPRTTDRSSSDRDFRNVSRLPKDVPLEQRRGIHNTRHLRTRLGNEGADGLQEESVPAEHAALAQIQTMCMEISRQQQTYTKENLWRAFVDYSVRGYPLSEDLGLQVVSALLTKQPVGDQNVEVSSGLPDNHAELALRVLEQLSLRGTNVLNMRVLTMLYQAFSPEELEMASQDRKAEKARSRIFQLIEILNVPFDPEQARILMVSLFRNQDYDGFWKLWRKLPLDGSSRTAADYERLFELHAELGDERRARDCIATWVPMMAREDPPIVSQGLLLRHIMYCVVIVDPEIEQTASQGSRSNLARLWRECREKMLAENEQF